MSVTLKNKSVISNLKILFFCLLLLQLIVISFFAYHRKNVIVKKYEVEKINYIINNKLLIIENNISVFEKYISNYARHSVLVNYLKNKNITDNDRSTLDNYLKLFEIEQKNINSILIMNTDFEIVAANNLFNEQLNKRLDLVNAPIIKEKDYFYSLVATNLPGQTNLNSFLFSKKIIDYDNKTLGYIIIYMDIVKFLNVFDDESYVNNYLILISPTNTDKVVFRNSNKDVKTNNELETFILNDVNKNKNISTVFDVAVKNKFKKLNVHAVSPNNWSWNIVFILNNNTDFKELLGQALQVITMFSIIISISYTLFYLLTIHAFKNPFNNLILYLKTLNNKNLYPSYFPLSNNEFGTIQNEILIFKDTFRDYHLKIKELTKDLYDEHQSNVIYIDRNSNIFHNFQQKTEEFGKLYLTFVENCNDFNKTLESISTTHVDKIVENSKHETNLIKEVFTVLNNRKAIFESGSQYIRNQELLFQRIKSQEEKIDKIIKDYQVVHSDFNSISHNFQREIEKIINISHNATLTAIDMKSALGDINNNKDKINVLYDQIKDVSTASENFFISYKKEFNTITDKIDHLNFVNNELENIHSSHANLVLEAESLNNNLNTAFVNQYTALNNVNGVIENLSDFNYDNINTIRSLKEVAEVESSDIINLTKSIGKLNKLNRNDIESNLELTIENLNIIKQTNMQSISNLQKINSITDKFKEGINDV